jgi:secondary thiamine-phosphate synthase enzyme
MERAVAGRLSAIERISTELIATAELTVQTRGEGFTDITREAACFVEQSGGRDGLLFVYLRHTSASLTIQENADPDVQTDLTTALRLLAPADGPWIHTVEGPDDMPAHIKGMLTGVSLHIPVRAGVLGLGTWQGLYLVEHRSKPHQREIVLQFVGTLRA